MKVNKIGKKKSRDFDSSILLSPAGIFKPYSLFSCCKAKPFRGWDVATTD